MNTSTGAISGAIPTNGGTPGSNSTVSSTITATNALGTDSKTLTWNITAAAITTNGAVSPTLLNLGSSVTLTRAGSLNFGLAWTENVIWKPDGTAEVLGNKQFGSQSYTPNAGPGTYYYQIRFVDSYANFRDQWITFTVYDLNPPASVQVATLTPNAVSLTWSAAANASGYNIYRNGTKLNSSLVTGTSYTDSTALPNSSYSYTVRAVDALGTISADSAAVSVMTPAVTTTGSLELLTPVP